MRKTRKISKNPNDWYYEPQTSYSPSFYETEPSVRLNFKNSSTQLPYLTNIGCFCIAFVVVVVVVKEQSLMK